MSLHRVHCSASLGLVVPHGHVERFQQRRRMHGRARGKDVARIMIHFCSTSVPARPRISSLSSTMDDVPDREDLVLDWARAKLKDWCALVGTKADHQDSAIHALLKFCMLLSLEDLALSSQDGTGLDCGDTVGYIQRGTWSLQNIKALAVTVEDVFIKAVAEDGCTNHEKSMQILAQKYPMTLISSINHVLFEQQGFTRMKQFGNLECFQLSKVLDNGVSCPILLAIVYMAVAEESGIPLHALVLEEGSYVVLWPRHGDFSSCVIDPYARGILIAREEIAELFEVEIPLEPSSLQDIAHAVLTQVLYTCWSAALKLPPEPAFRIPISLEVALGEYQDVSYSYGGKENDINNNLFLSLDEDSESSRIYMQRCMTAAETLCFLHQDSYESKLQLAILCYFAKDYTRATEILGELLLFLPQEDATAAKTQDSMSSVETNLPLPENDRWSVEKQRMMILQRKCILCSSL